MRPVLEAERLLLRPLDLADAPAISRYTRDPAVARMTGSIPEQYPVVAAEGWIEILRARAPAKREFVYAVEAPGAGLVGVIGAHGRAAGVYEVGYWIGRPFWGRGYATEAARALAREARALGPLIAAHYVDNPASGRVLEKAGFVYTGAIAKLFSIARGRSDDARMMKLDSARLAA